MSQQQAQSGEPGVVTTHRRDARDEPHVDAICAIRPDLETALGLTAHVDRLPVPGRESFAQLLDANLAWRRDLESQATESRERLLDARVFSASLELVRFCDGELQHHARDPDVVSPLAESLLVHLRGLAPVDDEMRFETLARRLRGVGAYLRASRDVVTQPVAELAARTRDIIDGMPDLLRAIGEAATQAEGRGMPGALVGEIAAASDQASAALDEHRDWLTTTSSVNFTPMGLSRFDELLRLRGLDLTSAEVLDLGRSLAEEARVEQARIIRRGFKGQSAESALATARKNTPMGLPEAIAWARELVDHSRSFLVDNGAMPIPSPATSPDGPIAGERLHVDVLPACLASATGEAFAYLPPQPYAARQDALLLVREPAGAQSDALRELSVADLESYVASLAFPGRHALEVWANRTTTLARRGAQFGAAAGPASTWGLDMVAGWELAASELMRELHFRHSPASRLVMVRHALLRSLLAVADVALAIGRMTPEQAASFLVRTAGVRLPVARGLVRHMLHRPTAGLSAIVGKVRIEQLRREAYRRWRGGFSLRRFHTLLVVAGRVPLAYLFERLDEPPQYISDVVTASIPEPTSSAG